MLNYQRVDDICWWNEMFLLCTKVFLALKNRLKCGLSSFYPFGGFLWFRATPSSHPFIDGMFHEINHPATSLGIPPFQDFPQLVRWFTTGALRSHSWSQRAWILYDRIRVFKQIIVILDFASFSQCLFSPDIQHLKWTVNWETSA